jgi:hypothetical protein
MFSTNASQVSTAANYIEDVFRTYLYTGNSSTQTITNGINLSTNGGLVWVKQRSGVSTNHALYDTARGATFDLASNTSAAQTTQSTGLTSFGSTGFSIGALAKINTSAATYTSWTFRKQAKFFDVVTYTGNGASLRAISHSLGSVPGCIMIKGTSTVTNWRVYHRSLGVSQQVVLNATDAAASSGSLFGNPATAPTDTNFYVGNDSESNANGATYVAYLFAHNAGGFGLTGNDNVISCGSFTTDVSGNATVNLGYEPQWLLIKRSDSTGNWYLEDTMRGWSLGGGANYLNPNANFPESNVAATTLQPNATGFTTNSTFTDISATYIYIAIRRGLMKVPTSGTSVFEAVTSTSTNDVSGSLQAFDMGFFKDRNTLANNFITDRLRGFTDYYSPTLFTNLASAEITPSTGDTVYSIPSTASRPNGQGYFGGAGATTDWPLGYSFKRAPGFFDEVCYTGTGSATTFSHNLGVIPELMIVKSRSDIRNWAVYTTSGGSTKYLNLNLTNAFQTLSTFWNNTDPTSNVFTVGTSTTVNINGQTYVNYLFASCPGVSKVGSYTGTGSTQTINCGFTGGARFVLIKRTDATGDWYVWDTTRGMVAGTDPSLLLNDNANEGNANSVYTTGVGFQIVSTAAGINASGGSYIFLAIA